MTVRRTGNCAIRHAGSACNFYPCSILNGSFPPVLELSDPFVQKEKAANCSFFFSATDVSDMHDL